MAAHNKLVGVGGTVEVTLERRRWGLECIGDVFSLCQVMIRTTTHSMALDCRHLTRTYTTPNQKQAAIMKDSRERWCDHGVGKIHHFGGNRVGE